MLPLAVITMVYEDEFFLRIWLSYWERFIPRKNIYVLIHGNYEEHEAIAEGCNTIRVHRPPQTANSEINRWKMISGIASGLTYMFKKVIYTDVDEIITLDPKTGTDLVQHILDLKNPVVSPFGLEVVDPIELQLDPINDLAPILTQRPFFSIGMPYSKPCIISTPTKWGSGGHFCDRQDIGLSDELFLFHLRLFDRNFYSDRANKRRAMVTDPETGKLIEGLGGPSWRRTDELQKYAIDQHDPLKDISSEKDRRMWLDEAALNEEGLWVRKGRLRKKLNHIPVRFMDLF